MGHESNEVKNMNIDTLTYRQFKLLALVVEGESKEVRYAGNGEVVIHLKPTIYSYTHNRTGEIPGSETLRLRAIQSLLPILRSAGVRHTYREVNDRWILSQLVLQPSISGDPPPFTPPDLNQQEINELPLANPIEIITKVRHSGTSKHRYYRFGDYLGTRTPRPHKQIQPDGLYPETIVRFDWRNPMHDRNGNRLADEILPEQIADWFIDTKQAAHTAQTAFTALTTHFKRKGLELWDICYFIANDGTTMFGEVSPDCMRVRATDNTALDKDVWRAGGSSELVLEKWQELVKLLES